MELAPIFSNSAFMACAALTVVTAIGVVAFNNILHAAISLFFCLLGISTLYVFLGADFLAMAQILIYAGGILVLIIFGVFLTARITEVKAELENAKGSGKIAPVIGVALFGVIYHFVISSTQWSNQISEIAYQATTQGIGNLFLTKFLLPFQFVALLLLFTLVGAVALVRKELDRKS